MKINKLYIATLLLVMGAASCQHEDSADLIDDTLNVNIEASVGESLLSKSNPTGTVEQQKVFNTGDQLAISNEGTFVNYALNGTTWTPTAGKYLKWEQNTMTFDAYYPVTEGTNMQSFTLPTEQSDLPKIALADYMTVSTELTKNGIDPINLTFEHIGTAHV